MPIRNHGDLDYATGTLKFSALKKGLKFQQQHSSSVFVVTKVRKIGGNVTVNYKDYNLGGWEHTEKGRLHSATGWYPYPRKNPPGLAGMLTDSVIQGGGFALGTAVAEPLVEMGKEAVRLVGKRFGVRNPNPHYTVRLYSAKKSKWGPPRWGTHIDNKYPRELDQAYTWANEWVEKTKRGSVHMAIIYDHNMRVIEEIGGHLENPGSLSQAESLSEQFHGRDSRTLTDYVEAEQYDDNLADLGALIELTILAKGSKWDIPIGFDTPRPRLAASADGQQLYVVGGDQSLGTADFKALQKADIYCEHVGEERTKRLIPIGTLNKIVYHADKHHLTGPAAQKQGMQYEHEFGEESGVKPMLVYDTLNKRLLVSGGNYRVEGVGIVD